MIKMSEKNDHEPMCKLKKKVLEEDIESYVKYMDDPGYLCCKCGRVANNKFNVCKPHELR